VYAVRLLKDCLAFLRPRGEEVVLLLELLQPGRIGELGSAFAVADCDGEALGLLSDLGIIQRFAFNLLILCPIGQRPLDVWKFALGLLCRTLAAII
jgi:hypothetical protein